MKPYDEIFDDMYEYDEPRGALERERKYLPAKSWQEDEIEIERDRLFDKGSDFKYTERGEIVGIDNVLSEIDEVIHWLAHSEEYQKYDSRLEPGVIFEGEPGTGKTLVSRYIASQSNALFVNVRDFAHTGSLFRDADIADLFARARQAYAEKGRPVVLFWDEFENGAVERAKATPEQVATVSQLTAELDGIHGKNEGIVLIGCTNYIYGIDQALKRSGRMGLQIEFGPPDREGKKLLLNHYLGQFKVRGKVDVDTLSYFFDSGATAADIEEACVEAWRYAVRRVIDTQGTRKKPSLQQEDLIKVFLKRLVGPPTTFINLPVEDRARIACHEVGHAIMALVYDIPLRLITVQPGKKSLGRTITAEIQEHIGTIDEMVSQIRVGIGSIVAEERAGMAASIGTTGDIRQINDLATKLVDTLHAGSESGVFNVMAVANARAGRMETISPNISEAVIAASDRDVRRSIDTTYRDAQLVMERIGKDNLWAISNEVNEKITLTGDEFKALFVRVTGQEPQSFRPGP